MIKSFAKVNLNLKVYKSKKRFHKIKSIFTNVEDLYDEIEIEDSIENKDIIICNIKDLEKNNFVYDVLKILRAQKIISKFYKVFIKKNIPVGSGLGGGSSNVIAVAKHFTSKKTILKKIAKKIGTDCFFFISGFQSALVSGYGNKVKKINKNFNIKKEDLIFTNIECNTKKVYEKFDEIEGWKNKTEPNMLEIACVKIYPELETYRQKGQMTGSGSTFIKKTSLNK